MARDDAPPFARGETWYNGSTIDPTDNTTLGGVGIEGKEYTFEVNSQDQGTGYPAGQDQSGRPIRVKVVRNSSGVNLLPSHIARFQAASTATAATTNGAPYECRVDGYALSVADRPAGVIDEFLPAAGVPPNDLFYVVVGGPSTVTSGTVGITTNPGDRLVVATEGATQGDPLGGVVALQSVAAASEAPLAEQIFNQIGFTDAVVAASTTTKFNVVVSLFGRW